MVSCRRPMAPRRRRRRASWSPTRDARRHRADGGDRRRRVRRRHRARPADRLVPDRRVRRRARRSTRCGTSCHLLRAGLRARRGRRPLQRLALPHAPGRGGARTARRSTATRGSRSSGRRSRRSCSSRSARTPTRADRHRGREGRRDAVRVVGEQFTWTFYYQGPGGRSRLAPALRPARPPVNFTVQSKDVIHDFWVPAFRMKIDAVPGINTNFRVTPTRIGDYPVVCAELCGLGHSACARPPTSSAAQAFDRWLPEAAAAGRAAAAPGGGGRRRRRRTARRSSPRRLRRAATRLPTRARPAATGPTSTRS